MTGRGRVGSVARTLGFAGLLPQATATGLLLVTRVGEPVVGTMGSVVALALVYPLVILSFLGGTWWGLAMRAEARQAAITACAIMPSLIAVALLGLLIATHRPDWTLIALGIAILATLRVDRWLVTLGLTPKGWMHLRVPLSVGLGLLTIATGALVSGR